MPIPSFSLSISSPSDVACDVLLLRSAKTADGPRLSSDVAPDLDASLAAVGATGASEELVRLPAPTIAAGSVAIVGTGEDAEAGTLRDAVGGAIRRLAGTAHVAVDATDLDGASVEALLEGALLGSYAFTRYRSASAGDTKTPVATVTVLVSDAITDAERTEIANRARSVATAIASVKDLVNIPPSDLYPESFADHAVESLAGTDVEVTVWDEEALARDGFGGILGVGIGSSRGPRLVRVDYAPDGATKHIALVGKGITFDTGGLSLKPAGSMVGMKYDMTGAATVLAAVAAVAERELPVRVTGWLCLAENMPSGTAMRPEDVITIRGGRTVEVLNTDAEGRLVMADGLVAASEESPDVIVDIATLTGAAGMALGSRYSGVMGDDTLVKTVVDLAGASGETFWPMPLPAELRGLLASDVADIANAKMGNRNGGMLLAGVFLREFVGSVDGVRIPWAHIDIAATANNEGSPYGFTGKGPTGVGVRTLVALAEHMTRA
ncbi:leucyl aminopeptidase [Labedella endophytica]|uniref:Probable cytosol aminopeptidase n=1 Tax=Labedella endophytica TaxID=1523160 RepID=A0A433JS84_9MICO|nr:leucyl aminopeptidase [Labedella endophytica]RUR00774.1 leucyl aminopeptidase [Labedella endophytica]